MALLAKWSITDVIEEFFSYFRSKGYFFIQSSPLIPVDGPTAPIVHAALSKLSTQGTQLLCSDVSTFFSLKCIRASDEALEHFRTDTSYHTLTQLLVCVTFDNFESAWDLSFKLLTERYLLPEDKIQLSYFGGDKQLSGDDETPHILKKYLPAERIVSMGKDNFWSAGDTGPCGPCVTIRIDASDLGDNISFVEVACLVFVKFNRHSDGVLQPLEAKPVITAMNVESLASILQEKASHYLLEIFTPTIDALEYFADEVPDYGDKVGADDMDGIDMSYRLIADHIRTIAAIIPYHAQLGGTEGREYFLKRLDIQAIQCFHQVFKLKKDDYQSLVSNACLGYVRTVLNSSKGCEDIIDIEGQIFEKTTAEIKELESQPAKLTKKKKSVQQEHNPPVVFYETRMVEYLGRCTHIILKDKSRQSSLVALCNVLLLGGKMVLELGSTTKVSEGHLLHLVQKCLLYNNSLMQFDDKLGPSDFQNQVLGVLPHLRGSLYFNITFDSIAGFKLAPEVDALFKYLEVPLYHGWMVEPHDKELASAMRRLSYVDHLTRVAIQKSNEESMEPWVEKPNKSMKATVQKTKAEKILERILGFLQGPQLTQYGFSSLHEHIDNDKPCVFIWNEQLITIIKFEEKIYKLVNEPSLPTSVVWERIIEVDHGGEFVNGSFAPTDAGLIHSTLPLTKKEKMNNKKKERKKKMQTGLESKIPPTETPQPCGGEQEGKPRGGEQEGKPRGEQKGKAETSASISHVREEQGAELDKHGSIEAPSAFYEREEQEPGLGTEEGGKVDKVIVLGLGTEEGGKVDKAETSVSISHEGDEQDKEQSGKLDKPGVADKNSPSSWPPFKSMMISLDNFVKQPGNNFAELKTIFSRGTSLVVSDTTRAGRVWGYGILKDMFIGHSQGISWNGGFDLTNIYLVDYAYIKIMAPVHECNENSMLQDRLQYVSKIIELFRTAQGLPAFFEHLTGILSTNVPNNQLELEHTWISALSTLALKSSLSRSAFFSGIHRIRRSAPWVVSEELQDVLNSVSLTTDWRQIITGPTGHPLLKKVLGRFPDMKKKKVGTGADEEVNAANPENGLYKKDINALSVFLRHVNEHGAPKDNDLTEEEEEPFHEPFDTLSELDLLCCHYLQDYITCIPHAVACSWKSDALWRWVIEVLDEYDSSEALHTTVRKP